LKPRELHGMLKQIHFDMLTRLTNSDVGIALLSDLDGRTRVL